MFSFASETQLHIYRSASCVFPFSCSYLSWQVGLVDPARVHPMVCIRSWHLPRNPKLVWHPARLIKEGTCVDQSLDTLHLTYPLVRFGSEGSTITLPLFLLSPRILMLFHCSSTMTKDY